MCRHLLPIVLLRRHRESMLQVHHLLFIERTGIRVAHEVAMPGPVRFFTPTPGDIAALAPELGRRFRLGRTEVLARYARGCRVAVAQHEGRIIAMRWTAYHEQPVSDIGMVLTLRPDEYATFDAQTLPAWRRRGLSTRLNDELAQAAHRRGRTRHLSWQRLDDGSALRVAWKLGERAIGSARATWLSGARASLEVHWDTPLPPSLQDVEADLHGPNHEHTPHDKP